MSPPRAKTGNVLVGTASWTDASLVKSGRFYPPDAKTAEQRLRYYASQFSVVGDENRLYERRWQHGHAIQV